MTALHLHEATKAADASIAEARQAAEQLATIMQKIHGGEWRVVVDHSNEFVLLHSYDRREASA